MIVMKNKNRFTKAFRKIDSEHRKEKILELVGQPYSWNVCYIEIENDTKIGEKMIDKLIEGGKI